MGRGTFVGIQYEEECVLVIVCADGGGGGGGGNARCMFVTII